MVNNAGGMSAGTTNLDAGNANLNRDMDELRSDLARIKEDMGMMAQNISGRAQQTARELRDDAQLRIESGLEQFEQYVEEKPLTTVLTAFGIGLLVGAIITR